MIYRKPAIFDTGYPTNYFAPNHKKLNRGITQGLFLPVTDTTWVVNHFLFLLEAKEAGHADLLL
jgi:hypothetical protein